MTIAAAPAEIARQEIDTFTERVAAIRLSLHKVIIGQEEAVDLLLVCALTGSHALLVGVPGLAKTLMVKTLATAFDWKFARVQFTPDLMPSDVTGYELLGRDEGGQTRMDFRPGPVFGNLVLADEINRATPKTQSALLEAMAEQHVTLPVQHDDAARHDSPAHRTAARSPCAVMFDAILTAFAVATCRCPSCRRSASRSASAPWRWRRA